MSFIVILYILLVILLPDITNVNGGAITLSHLLGYSGMRILTTLVHEMKKQQVKYGLVTLCVGVVKGVSTLVELV